MAGHDDEDSVQLLPIEREHGQEQGRKSAESTSSASTTSLIFERINERAEAEGRKSENGNSKMVTPKFPPRGESLRYADDGQTHGSYDDEEKDDNELESGPFLSNRSSKTVDKKLRRLIWIIGGVFMGAWLLALAVFLGRQAYRPSSAIAHDPTATKTIGSGKKITLDQVQTGQWRATKHDISWIEGANGEDGLLLKQGQQGNAYLVVEDVRGKKDSSGQPGAIPAKTLMKDGGFQWGGSNYTPSRVYPSRDLKKVLIATDFQSNWRHSFHAKYFILDVETQSVDALDPSVPDGRVQLASWSPQSDAVVFTRDNNLFLRKLSSENVTQITTDGGPDLFYGVPDWVYEEEVFAGNSATWWADDGKYVAFLRTNESQVPVYPLQYFVSRPSGKAPEPGLEHYPEVREIKYPKPGAPNPTVDLQFYDVGRGDVFEVKVADTFPPDDLLITEVVWAGASGKALIRETNRESDILRVVLVDVELRTGKTVRTQDVQKLDGGWFEVSEHTKYVPADPAKGRPHDGYIDTVIHENYNHIGYFTPLDNPNPVMLTSGNWEVVDAPSAVDLKNNLVYFIAAKPTPIQRQIYSVKLDGTGVQALTDDNKEGYYGIKFSSGAGYALLSYNGPNIPWQKVINTRSNSDHYEDIIEENPRLYDMAKKHELPIDIFSTVNIDGFDLQVVERRPPHFDEKKKYPVLFHLYGGPGSQTVQKTFKVDFQAYIAANLGYIVVTVDNRGTGYIGRKARTIIRGNIGYYESYDQIETAKMWAKKKYVDASRMAIWGWSYGGFLALKTLEQDAGRTFSYGMAVAPVTDWRYYDSIYTERYMHTPQHNPGGYDNASISNVSALHQNVRFLVMHGVADDNVHVQNSLTLLDKLDVAGVENYDVHFFPDSDHGIFFHNANRIVYDKLSNWLINAFNGEWLRTSNPVPLKIDAPLERE
ncbi:putative dipeptidyl-aminopeptidase B [Venustampulla echinocandica]|uniref:dipeptidyl-peptidase IV n=1 Tax=Venustampulla echinocandica TaxID=2656787 RepID=A0A370TS67_9HELO|nr:putative dipeptidyl-aminopeptidase B [Venustampulla echinocandica]RDL38354.1 putative dipeptidyl-aminopeptidase B [Venustampulla echinocandica]